MQIRPNIGLAVNPVQHEKDGSFSINTEEKLGIIREILTQKKAENIETIELGNRTVIADYFVVCSGTSNTHIKAVADGLLTDGREQGLRKMHMEGHAQAKWVLVDYGDVVVHIFANEEREFYDIESLWKETAVKLGKAAR